MLVMACTTLELYTGIANTIVQPRMSKKDANVRHCIPSSNYWLITTQRLSASVAPTRAAIELRVSLRMLFGTFENLIDFSDLVVSMDRGDLLLLQLR